MCSRCTPTSLLGSYKEDRGGEPEALVAIEASDYCGRSSRYKIDSEFGLDRTYHTPGNSVFSRGLYAEFYAKFYLIWNLRYKWKLYFMWNCQLRENFHTTYNFAWSLRLYIKWNLGFHVICCEISSSMSFLLWNLKFHRFYMMYNLKLYVKLNFMCKFSCNYQFHMKYNFHLYLKFHIKYTLCTKLNI